MARFFIEFEEGTPREKMMKIITGNGCTLVKEKPGQPPTFVVSAPDGKAQECVNRFNGMSSIRVKTWSDIQFQTFK